MMDMNCIMLALNDCQLGIEDFKTAVPSCAVPSYDYEF